MAEKLHVRPVGPQPALAHPIDGPIASKADTDGNWSFWTADQFTFQLVRDGAIERVPDASQETAPPADQSEPPALTARKKEPR